MMRWSPWKWQNFRLEFQ